MVHLKNQRSKTIFLSLLLYVLASPISAQNGNTIFCDTFLHKIELFDVDMSLIKDPEFKSVYQNVDITIDGNTLKNVGLATKGEKSYLAAPNDKKPFKIKTDKFVSGQKYDGIKRFNLHNNLYDKCFMREKLTSDASWLLGIPAPKCAFTEVHLNGEYWGIYTLVEAQDEIYKRIFGNNNGYAIESFGSSANLDNLAYYGKDPENYQGQYIVDQGDDKIAWQYWLTLLNKIHTLSPRYGYVDSISKYIDYQTYFKFNAVLDYNLNAEPKNRNGIYYYDVTEKKWFTICWDQNVAFADFTQPDQNKFPNTQMTAFLDKYNIYSAFSEAYDHAICQLVQTIFTDKEVISKITAYRKIIDGAVEKDLRKGFSFKEYELSLTNLRDFIRIRNSVATNFLEKKNYSCMATATNPEQKLLAIKVFPVPAHDFLNVIVPENGRTDYSISNLQGSVLQKGKIQDSGINLSLLPPGIYFLNLKQPGKLPTLQKIIKW